MKELDNMKENILLKYKKAIERMGKFGQLFVEYEGCPRGPMGRLCCNTIQEEALAMDMLTDIDGGKWRPINEEVLQEIISKLNKRKENNIMNTAEMWIKGQEDGMCYETIEQGPDAFTLYYQKDKGLFDDDGVRCGPETWNYLDDLMNEQWRLRTMTKSEAEAKFNIKIVGE